MPYTIRPKNIGRFGSFAALASDARQALDIAQYMIQRGVKVVEIIADEEVTGDLVEHLGLELKRAAND